MGVNINRTIAITFLIGSALAGAAGVVKGLYFGNIQFDLGFQAGLKAFTAAVLGGIGNITGAALGGFVIGFVEIDRRRVWAVRLGPGDRVRSARHHPRLPAVRHCSASSWESEHDRRELHPAAAGTARLLGSAPLAPDRGLGAPPVAHRHPVDGARRHGAAASSPPAAAVQRAQRHQRLDRRVHQSPASTCCSPSASTSWSACPACSTSATRRSSRSVPTRMRSWPRRSPGWTSRSGPCSSAGRWSRRCSASCWAPRRCGSVATTSRS